ncbi:MAG: hypothetical protein O3B87_04530 [bacterium]|nr:hypothetical protein [bacterium]
MSINLKLEELYLKDKQDRNLFEKGKISDIKLKENDTRRLQHLKIILPEIDESDIWNCHYACLILMHSWKKDQSIYKQAHDYAKKAVDMGSNVTKWLYAASLDRWLVSQGKLQKYGTQYDTKTGIILPYEDGITDEERKEYYVPPLSELKLREVKE